MIGGIIPIFLSEGIKKDGYLMNNYGCCIYKVKFHQLFLVLPMASLNSDIIREAPDMSVAMHVRN